MEIRSGRQREASEIVRYKKAAAVGRLLLGELDDPMEPISIDQYVGKPRRDLVSQRDASRSFLRGEVAKFCRNNFENVEPEDLAKLYDLLFVHGSNWFIPLTDFERDFGDSRSASSRVRRFIPLFTYRPGGCKQSIQSCTSLRT